MGARTELGSPLFLLNLKAYPRSIGTGAREMGRTLAQFSKMTGVSVAIAPTPPLVGLLASELTIPVLAQHADPFEAGARTGHVPPAAVRASGAVGSLVNHSEHRLPRDAIAAVVRLLEAEGLTAVVCAGDVAESRELAALCKPPYLAVEPPELIGGDVSVSRAKPEVIRATVEAVHQVSPATRVLCGAGIKNAEDVRRSLELGAEGVLVASAVANARDPPAAIQELLGGFPSAPAHRAPTPPAAAPGTG